MHEEQLSIFLEFLSYFVKPENFNDITMKKLSELDFENSNLQCESEVIMFIGAGTERVIASLHVTAKDSCVKEFLNLALAAYVDCASYIKKKLPLDSLLLRSVSALDPIQRGRTSTVKKLKRLAALCSQCSQCQ